MKNEKNKDQAEIGFDFGKFCKLCLRHWQWFIVGVVACGMLAGAFKYISPTKSEVVASLKLPPEINTGGIMAISDLASSFNFGDMFGSSSTDNEVAMLSSHSVYMKTVKDLNLNVAYFEKLGPMKWSALYADKIPLTLIPTNAEINDTISRQVVFNVNVNDNGTFDINAKVKYKTVCKKVGVSLPCEIATNYGTFVLDTTAAFAKRNPKVSKYRIKFSSYNAAAQSLAQVVKAYAPDKKTTFIALSYVTTDPKYGEMLLNNIIDNYNIVCNEQRNDQDANTLNFVNIRLTSLENELAANEVRMEEFKKANKLTDVEIDAAALMEMSTEIEKGLITAQIECEALQMAKQFISNQDNKYSLIPSISSGDNATGASLSIDTYNQMILQRMRLLDSSTPNNTSLKRLDAELDAMRKSVIESIDRNYDHAKVMLDQFNSKNATNNSRLSTLPSLEREYISIKRDLVLQQQLYLFLLKQREEATMNLTKVQPSLVTVDTPYTLAEPAGLSTKMLLALAFLMGIILPMALLYFMKYKKAPLTRKDIETLAKAPIVGCIIGDSSNGGMPVLENAGGESIRQLRSDVTRILDGLAPAKKQAVLVASAADGEGKTYLATNLAASLALLGNKVLLVEADLSKAGEPVMGHSPKAGIADIIDNGSAAGYVADIDLGANGARLSLLGPGNLNGRNGDDILGHEAVKDAIAKLMADYQYTVIDTASFERHSGAFELASLAGLTLCPAAVNRSTADTVEQVNTLCEDGRLPRVAFVINMA